MDYCTYLRFINGVIGVCFIFWKFLSVFRRRNWVCAGKKQSLNLELFLPVSIFRVWILLRLSEFQGLRTIKFRNIKKKTRMAYRYIFTNVYLLQSLIRLTAKLNFLFSILYRWWIFSSNTKCSKHAYNSKTLNMISR